MATREEWVRHFEDVNGRKPSPEELSADSVADTQLDEVQVTLEEEAPNHMPELNLEKEQEKETPKASQIPLENPYYKPKVTKNNAFVNIALPIIILVLGILFVVLSLPSLPSSLSFWLL